VAQGSVIASAGNHLIAWTPRRRHVGGLGMSVAAPWRGCAVRSLLTHALIDWADNWTSLIRVEFNCVHG